MDGHMHWHIGRILDEYTLQTELWCENLGDQIMKSTGSRTIVRSQLSAV